MTMKHMIKILLLLKNWPFPVGEKKFAKPISSW